MAALREVPFGRYYGGVDTTPLFVMLAGAYLKRTNDESFARDLWPAVRAALDWMENFGDADRDGFIEYRRGAESGLSNQGWKDSHDSIFHADGNLARGAIAVVEVQAYAVAANRAAAQIAALVGETNLARSLEQKAARLAALLDTNASGARPSASMPLRWMATSVNAPCAHRMRVMSFTAELRRQREPSVSATP